MPFAPPRWVLIGGYLVNPNSIPVWLRWVRDLSPLSFAFEVLAANEMADQFFSIKVDGLPSIGGIKGDGACARARVCVCVCVCERRGPSRMLRGRRRSSRRGDPLQYARV